jgi:predicted amidohydrolase
VPGDDPDRRTKTLAKMTQHVSEAAAQNADLVVFPEICAYLNAPDT